MIQNYMTEEIIRLNINIICINKLAFIELDFATEAYKDLRCLPISVCNIIF